MSDTLRDAVGRMLYSEATVGGACKPKAQSLSFVISSLRYDRFRVTSRYFDQVAMLVSEGFHVARGRMKNNHRAGYSKECDVVYCDDQSAVFAAKPQRTIPITSLRPASL